MKFAVNIPPFADFSTPQALAAAAHQAEQAGWDGFFLWDHMLFSPDYYPIADPWISLAAIAMSTERMRIGPMITPLARRRPWKLAREAVAVDQLSQGRLVLGVGLGTPEELEFGAFGEETNPRQRADKLDEGLDILAGLWSGKPFHYQGKHYQLAEMVFQPIPVQAPRIPIWVGGYWPAKAPFRRAARWDGVFPGSLQGDLTPEDWREILGFIRGQRQSAATFDAVHSGILPADPSAAQETVHAFAEAGVTWWVELNDPWTISGDWRKTWSQDDSQRMLERIRRGPPHFAG